MFFGSTGKRHTTFDVADTIHDSEALSNI